MDIYGQETIIRHKYKILRATNTFPNCVEIQVQILAVHDKRQCDDDDVQQGGASAAPHPPPRLHRPLHRLCHQEEARHEFR